MADRNLKFQNRSKIQNESQWLVKFLSHSAKKSKTVFDRIYMIYRIKHPGDQ